MSAAIYALEDAPDDTSAVGGKAASLGRLLRAGLPVPPGFVLTADAFRAFISHSGVDSNQSPTDREVAAGFQIAHWPDGLHAEVARAFDALRARTDGAPVAVRSSATAEDSESASFAGQHATLLNLHGLDAVLDAVLACWASLYAEGAAHYRAAQRVNDNDPAMAVVVQALVPAEASGVAFTIDPVSGGGDVVLIDAAWGLGEGIVGGIVTPDHFAVRKGDGAIVRRDIAQKHARVTASEGGGTQRDALPAEEAARPSLTDDQVIELARLATRVEALYDAPQDIEWALAGGRFYLLQSRPVTAAATAPPAEEWVSEFDTETSPDTIWTAVNVQEVLPDQLSPFGCSITLAMLEQYGNTPIERTGVRLTNKDPFSAYFYGRAFLNASMTIEMADQLPFGSPEAVTQQFYGEALKDAVVQTPRTPAKVFRYLLALPRLIWFTMRMPADIRRAERMVADMEREAAAAPARQQPDGELLSTLTAAIPRMAEVSIIHVSGSGITSSNFEMLRRCTQNWLDDADGSLHATLCSGLAIVESAQPAFELWDISRAVLANDALRAAFEPHDGAEIERRLAALPDAGVSEFRTRLDAFVARYGHRSVMEAEVSARSWSEDLPTVFAMVRNYLHADPSSEPRLVEERQRREREEATAGAKRRLNWWRRRVFQSVLGGAQEWVAKREHTKSLMVRAIYLGRALSREVAHRLVMQGKLNDLWDMYYLTYKEAEALSSGTLSSDEAKATIARRRAEEERNRAVLLPDTFRGHPKPLRAQDLPLPDGNVLHGVPVSPGRVTGPARVIMDPRLDAGIEPGEILVAPVTDAGWTPLFIAAAGVVVDIGGPLSHGSTVAREFGLPAVVNVKHGTRVIRTGQVITVDGSQGVVILETGS